MTEFERGVFAWLKTQRDDAAELIEVYNGATDWAGSTEHGFYETFAVDIYYLRTNGQRGFLDARGEVMGKLWDFLMAWQPE